jgi:hypothetical protein
VRDRVAWAGGGSLNCGSDWDEDLDMFSRPCNPGGGMTGSCCFEAYTGVEYREEEIERAVMWSLYPEGGLLVKCISKRLRERRRPALHCSIVSNQERGCVRRGRGAWHWLQADRTGQTGCC